MNAWQWFKMLFTRRLVVRKGAVIDNLSWLTKGGQLYVPYGRYDVYAMMDLLRTMAKAACSEDFGVYVREITQRVTPFIVRAGAPFHFTYEVRFHDAGSDLACSVHIPHDHTTSKAEFLCLAQQKLSAGVRDMREALKKGGSGALPAQTSPPKGW